MSSSRPKPAASRPPTRSAAPAPKKGPPLPAKPMMLSRQFNLEEAAVIRILIDHDDVYGRNDDYIQHYLGVSPCLEAVDSLADSGFIAQAIGATGKPMVRSWRVQPAAVEILHRQLPIIEREWKSKIERQAVEDEKARLYELLAIAKGPETSEESKAPSSGREPIPASKVPSHVEDVDAKGKVRPKQNVKKAAPKAPPKAPRFVPEPGGDPHGSDEDGPSAEPSAEGGDPAEEPAIGKPPRKRA